MSTQTTNFGLVKPELGDAADITAMNQNWDKIDETLKQHDDYTAEDVGALPISGGELTGELIVNQNFQVRQTYNDVQYRSYLRPVNYELGGECSTGIIHYNNGTNDAQLVFNKNGVALRDNVNAKLYQIFGQHNAETAAIAIRSHLYTYGTTDLTAGSSALTTGRLHYVYE